MKKNLLRAMILSLSAVLIFTGCSGGKDDSKDDTAVVQQKVEDSSEQIIKATDLSKNVQKAKDRKDTFVAAISAPGGVFLPYFYDNGWDGNATSPMFSALVGLDRNGKVIPDLAESWDISKDQLTYTFHLRKNLKFSDGSPLTADDVAFTLTLLDDPAYSGDMDISLASIKGGDDYKNGSATSISGIKVIDPQTVEITTEKVNAQSLTTLGVQVLSKAYYGKDYKKGQLDYLKSLYPAPLGAGPYKLDKYVPGQEIRYTANENYYGGKPSVEHLIYKVTSKDTKLQLFQTGETDYDGFTADEDTVDQLKGLGFANIRIATANTYSFLYINNKKPYLKDTLVRQALIYGLDRKKYVDVAYKGYGQVANVPASPVLWSYSDDGVNKYEFNTDKAKELLDKAGWKVGADGVREKDGQKLKINYLARSKDDELIPIAKENYKALGIDFNAEIMDFNALVAKLKKGDYDFAAVSTSMLGDPNDAVGEFLSTSQGNYSGYSNPKIDKLILDGIATTDVAKRKEIYKELYKEFSNDPPIILLNYRKSVAAYNGRIEGLDIDNFNGIGATLAKVKIKQ
ncbi:ABC transporter substrate-binding protein [Clostridium manihotivorum]|uniref:ABC transporter substrate-binding protein n=1 Tax=Clostridium manihotivorum TaxID=2320868 RepID=A0A3R5WZL1_9CLOT|nr:ABC transporter substrate-binding protein [Clostridium manihotivorum]QAA30523.1 ABC transporter substrate-binding protein [Clostridium manihotivorum]